MKKSYKIILSLILLLPAFTGIAQDHLFKSKLPPALGASDSRFNVVATVMDNDTWCRLEWPGIYNFDELAFDDGEADDYFIFSTPGGINANKFTPLWYPADITGGRIYVGNGLFPGPFIGTQFRAMIFDDNGPNGLPGTILDSMDVTVENYYWVEFEGMSAIINSGSFYLGMKQLAASPDAAPIGVDTDNPTYNKSYSYLDGSGWVTSPLQDFMIRAWIANGNTNGNVDFYQVDRFSGFDPNGSPLLGDTTFLDNVTNPCYNDFDWAALPMGWYAYGVKEHYVGGGWSEYNLSNLAGHLTSYAISINISLCDTSCWESTLVIVNGEEVPAELTPGGATVTLEFNSPFPVGIDIEVYSPGNDPYFMNNVSISPDEVINIFLSCTHYPARNLAVDPVSLIATWEPPQVVPLEQNFESDYFPPMGWQMQSQGSGWFRTEDGSGEGWNIPGWNSNYACTNDLLSNGNDGSMDYLVTPIQHLDYRLDYVLCFDNYFDGYSGQSAYVEYTIDGEDWNLLYEIESSTAWENIELNLAAFSGPDGPPQVSFAFHADDNGQDASGWAVDNVRIFSPDPPYTVDGYWVYVDDSLFAVTDANFIDLSPLTYGEYYTISVKAHYPSGLSIPVTDTVFSQYLYPPSCFYQADTGNMPLIICAPYDSTGAIPVGFLGYNLYHDGSFIDFLPSSTTSIIPDFQPGQPGIYIFDLTTVYDLTPYGYPEETGESMPLYTDYIVRWGYPLPFLEPWNSGTFGTNNWLPETENWSINGNEGNPDPSAQFTWDPIQNNYQIALESYPLLADSMTEGQIYLDFDLKLDDVTPTGTEQMLVQVWNWDSQVWSTVSTYSNVDGSFDWVSEHLDITSQAIGTVFKIRFLASGENSINILSWFVDNIHVYRDCKRPYYLTVEAIGYPDYGIMLNWEEPYGPDNKWIEWDDGINSGNSIGTGDEVEFDVASRWTPSQLTEYLGYEITQIAFFPAEAQASYNVRVWTGPNAVNLVVDQHVSDPIIGQWNYITLNSPYMLDISQELWVGYYVNASTGYPAGADDGPAIDGYGNMMNFGGWQTLLEINPDLDFNWNIKANIIRDIASDTVTKYAIYRSDHGEPYYLRGYTEVEEFLDDSAIYLSNCPFCYYVTAIYSSDLDWCESGPSNESCEICEGIKEEEYLSDVKIYPNPASDVIFIESSENIEKISIFNPYGELLKSMEVDEKQAEIGINAIPVGVYLVRVLVGKEFINRKIIIKH